MHDIKQLILFFGFALLGACSVEPPEDSDAARPPVVGGDGVRLTDTGDTRRIDVDATQTPVVEDCAVGQVVIRTADGWGCLDPVALNRSVFSVAAASAAECPGGGAKVSTGLDRNRDGVLQAEEAADTTLVCSPTQDAVAESLSADAMFTSTVEANVLTTVDEEFVRLIGDTTLTVGPSSEFATVQSALASLEDARIRANAIVTVRLEPLSFNGESSYVYTSPIEVNHPDGKRIHIVAGTSPTDRAELKFNGSSGLVANGTQLGLFDRIELEGDGTQADADGVRAENGARLTLGNDVVVRQFGRHGLVALSGSEVSARGVESHNNEQFGFAAFGRSAVDAEASVSTGNDRRGYTAAGASDLNANRSLISNSPWGVFADSTATIGVSELSCTSVSGACFLAQGQSYVTGVSSSVSSCNQRAVAQIGGVVRIPNSSGSCSAGDAAGSGGLVFTAF